jgi:hypothetical protein
LPNNIAEEKQRLTALLNGTLWMMAQPHMTKAPYKVRKEGQDTIARLQKELAALEAST